MSDSDDIMTKWLILVSVVSFLISALIGSYTPSLFRRTTPYGRIGVPCGESKKGPRL